MKKNQQNGTEAHCAITICTKSLFYKGWIQQGANLLKCELLTSKTVIWFTFSNGVGVDSYYNICVLNVYVFQFKVMMFLKSY